VPFIFFKHFSVLTGQFIAVLDNVHFQCILIDAVLRSLFNGDWDGYWSILVGFDTLGFCGRGV
jgi:hypothetical protein